MITGRDTREKAQPDWRYGREGQKHLGSNAGEGAEGVGWNKDSTGRERPKSHYPYFSEMIRNNFMRMHIGERQYEA